MVNIFKSIKGNFKSIKKSLTSLKYELDDKMSKFSFDAQIKCILTQNNLFNELQKIHNENRKEYKLTLSKEVWNEFHKKSVEDLNMHYADAMDRIQQCKETSFDKKNKDIGLEIDKIETNIKSIYNDIVEDYINVTEYTHYVLQNNIKSTNK